MLSQNIPPTFFLKSSKNKAPSTSDALPTTHTRRKHDFSEVHLNAPRVGGGASPEDVAEQQGCVVAEGPVVVEGVDGGGQRLQDAVHDAGHQAAHVGAQVEVGVLDEALHHVQQPVELLQVVAHRLHLQGQRLGSRYCRLSCYQYKYS